MINIIAEIGINHDGDKKKAKKLIELSYESGVNSVKFQYRNLKNTYFKNVREIGDEILSKEINRNYLSPNEIIELCKFAKSLDLDVGISFFNKNDIEDFASDIDIFDFFKIPSVELSNKKLIDSLLLLDKHLYISLGAHDEQEIDKSLRRLPKTGWTPLHCVSNYPVTLTNPRLGYICYLKNKWNRKVGYSSHDDNWEVCLLAMQMGATVIERHITLDRNANGLDHSSSSTHNHFKKLVDFASAIPVSLNGNSPRIINQGELINRQNLGRSYYANSTYKKGDILNLDELIYRSPNTGLDESDINKYIGKPLQNDLKKGEVLSKYHFHKTRTISDHIIEKANMMKLSLPVRLHDYKKIEKLFPIGAYEFHLSFDELFSDINYSNINPKNKYSIHLPDYINPTQLMDPFSKNDDQKNKSIELINRAVEFAKKLQNISNSKVPIVGSFSVVNIDRTRFFEQHNQLFRSYNEQGVDIMPQWLPPIAWYFGGSIKLDIMNNEIDTKFLHQYDIDLCMDICHLILGRNYYNFCVNSLLSVIKKQIKHIHIADATGVDGEGVTIDENNNENTAIIKEMLDFDCMKVIEVWQGHLDNGTGFKNEIIKLTKIYEEK